MALHIDIWPLLFMYIAYMLSILVGPIFRTIVHDNAISELRAIIISTKNMLNRAVYIILMPLVGYLFNFFTLDQVSLIFAITIVVVATISIIAVALSSKA